MVICEALTITPEELLIGATKTTPVNKTSGIEKDSFENLIIEGCQNFSEEQKRRLLAYASMLQNMKKRARAGGSIDERI